METNMYYRYFVYSQEEEERKRRVSGPNTKLGDVIVRGVPKTYTSIVRDPKDAPADALIIAKGDIRKIKYTTPSGR